MRLFQYWDQPEPPEDVLALTGAIERDNPGFDYRRYDREGAAAFVARHYGPREQAAFAACAVPAMQADYVRLCFLDACGGLYVDADQRPHAPLDTLVARAPSLLIAYWMAMVNNAVMAAREPAHPYVRACLDIATDNILTRRFDDVLMTTGPGVLNAVRHVVDPEWRDGITFSTAMGGWHERGWHALLAHAYEVVPPDGDVAAAWRQATLVDMAAKDAWLTGTEPAYKLGERHWLNWPGPIYA